MKRKNIQDIEECILIMGKLEYKNIYIFLEMKEGICKNWKIISR